MFPKKWKYGVFAAGFGGITGQILLLRQLETLFGGNEISVGVFFACWLVWSALGAWSAKFCRNPMIFYGILAGQGAVLLGSVWLFRCWSIIIGRQAGVIMGLADMAAGGTALTAPFALVTGALFTLGIKASRVEPRIIYLWEAVGAGVGGIFTALMVGKIGYFQFGFLILGMNLLIALRSPRLQSVGVLVSLIGFVWGAPLLEKASLNEFWHGYTLIKHAESVYGDIAVTCEDEQYALFQNGSLSGSYPDPMSAEEAVHFQLLTHPNPQKVLLVGGGITGAVGEILEHSSVSQVDYAEVDAKLVQTIIEIFPPEPASFLNNQRVRVVEVDGRAWIKKAENNYDVIILAVPEPTTAMINRYFTLEFFREVRRALNTRGIFGFSLSSSEDYIDSGLADFLSGIRRTLERVFPNVVVLPGGRCQFIACMNDFRPESEELVKRLNARGVENMFVSPYILPFRLSLEKRDYLENSLAMNDSEWINRDFSPQGYVRALARWDRQFHPKEGRIYSLLWKFEWWMAAGTVLIFALLISLLSRGNVFERGVRAGLGLGGLAQMGMQLSLILGFQSIFGYMYYQQAVLIAGFMAGAAGGSFSARRWDGKTSAAQRRGFVRVQAGVVLLPLVVLAALFAVKGMGGISKHLLTGTAVLCGWVGGMQYSIGAGCLRGEASRRGGGLYAVDLAGAALGALAVGTLMIPLLNMAQTILILVLAGAAPLALTATGIIKNGFRVSRM